MVRYPNPVPPTTSTPTQQYTTLVAQALEDSVGGGGIIGVHIGIVAHKMAVVVAQRGEQLRHSRSGDSQST